MTIPGFVSTVYARPFASPKSVRFAEPVSSIITLDGLTSRCTMPPACSASNPDATWATTRTMSGSGSGPTFARRASRV